MYILDLALKTDLDLLKQETVSGSGISWTICKSASHSIQITTPAPTAQFLQDECRFYSPTVTNKQNFEIFIVDM